MTGTLRNSHGDFLISGVGGVFVHPTGELDIAGPDEWGINCLGSHHFPMSDPPPADGFYPCCGDRSEYPAIITEDVVIIEEPNQTLNRTWWHSSNAEDLVLIGPVHLGSRRAAEDRSVRALDNSRAKGISITRYLYEVKLEGDASIAPDVMVEITGSDHSHALLLLEEWDVVRYVNRAEAPGSVSLLANPAAVASMRLESSTTS